MIERITVVKFRINDGSSNGAGCLRSYLFDSDITRNGYSAVVTVKLSD